MLFDAFDMRFVVGYAVSDTRLIWDIQKGRSSSRTLPMDIGTAG